MDVPGGPKWMVAAFFNFQLGVQLFFVISGFVIAMTLERTPTWVGFTLSRLVRLVPAYVACSLATLAVIYVADFNIMSITPADLVANSTMVPILFGHKAIDPSAWTLTYEICFYAMSSVAFYAFAIRRFQLACLAWMAVGVLNRMSDGHLLGFKLGIFFNTNFSPIFVAGMMVYTIVNRRSVLLSSVVLAIAVGLMFLRYDPLTASACCVFVGLVWAAASGRLPPLATNVSIYAGLISYPLYLVHQIVGYWVIFELRAVPIPHLVRAVLALALSLLLAGAIYSFVERPVQRWSRRWLTRRKDDLVTS